MDLNLLENIILLNGHPYMDKVNDIIYLHGDTDQLVTLKDSSKLPPLHKNLDVTIVKILIALNYLHSNNIIYNNVNYQSIDYKTERLTNFNKALLNEYKYYYNLKLEVTEYVAPELLIDIKNISLASDLWSLGCLLFELEQKFKLFKPQPSANYYDPILYMLKHLDKSSEVKYSGQPFEAPNLIKSNNSYVNWQSKWTLIAIKHFFILDETKRTPLSKILKLPEIQKIIDIHQLYDNYNQSLIKEIDILHDNVDMYLNSLYFWIEALNLKIDDKMENLYIIFYHYIHECSEINDYYEKEVKIKLINYIIQTLFRQVDKLDQNFEAENNVSQKPIIYNTLMHTLFKNLRYQNLALNLDTNYGD